MAKYVRYTQETYTQERYERDMDLIDAVDNPLALDMYSTKRHMEDKIDILRRILGYNALRVGANKSEHRFVALEDCRPGRINRVIRSSYIAAINRVAKFGNPSEPKKKKTRLERKIEETGQLNLF